MAEIRAARAERHVADGARGGATGEQASDEVRAGSSLDAFVMSLVSWVNGFGFAVVAAVGVMDDSFDDARTLAQLAGATVEVFAARTGAVEHLRRGDVVNRAAEIARRVGVEVGERRILLAGLVVGQRVIHDRVLRDFRQRDVLAHVVQVRAVVLAHDEELAAVAEHSGADARLL